MLRNLRPRGIRSKITLGVATVLAVALVIASAALLWSLGRNLDQQADDAISTQADDRASLLTSGANPDGLVATRAREAFVWIGTPAGETVAAGGVELIELPVVSSSEVMTAQATYVEAGGKVEREAVRVTSRSSTTPSGQELVLLIGAERNTSSSTLSTTRRALWVIVPLLVIASAAATWIGVGRTLRPVDSIRADAARISGDHMDQRVPIAGSGDEIEDLARTVNSMLDRLSDHHRRTRQFSADASHELKTPAANLKAMLEVSTDESWRDTRTSAIGEIDRLVHIVDDLLFVNTSAERADAPGKPVHLDDVVFDEAELARHHTEARIDVAEVGPGDVVGDELALRRMMRNLIQNACLHAAEHVHVELSTRNNGTDQGVVRIVVSDDGPGIAAVDRERVFERFVRLDESRSRNSGGTGLGLAIVRGVVERHDGTIKVGSSTHGGAQFVVELPNHQD